MPIQIQSLAINFPQTVRTNDYWQDKLPALPDRVPRVRMPQPIEIASAPSGIDLWLQEVSPYLADPFRGSVERRVLAAGESSLGLESRALQSALTAADLGCDDLDLAIVCSLFPTEVAPGLAAHLSQQLGLRCPAWNLESTCASTLVALQTAQALIQTGVYRRIAIVVSQIGSMAVNDRDTLSWSMGDGAAAAIVSAAQGDRGLLSLEIRPTLATCGAYRHELTIDDRGQPRIHTRTGENASSLAATAAEMVRECCHAAVAAAGVSLDRIDYFAFNTPTAWYANVCARALGIDRDRVIDLYPTYANIGPVFPFANLYHGAIGGQLNPDDLVLVYANGAGATAAAMVMRWGEVALARGGNKESIVRQSRAASVGAAIAPRDRPKFDRQLLAAGDCAGRRLCQRVATIESYLIASLANLCQVLPQDLDRQVVLMTLLDSLIATIFRSQLEADLQVRVPMEKFLDNCTIGSLGEFLLSQIAISELMEVSDADIDREVFSL